MLKNGQSIMSINEQTKPGINPELELLAVEHGLEPCRSRTSLVSIFEEHLISLRRSLLHKEPSGLVSGPLG